MAAVAIVAALDASATGPRDPVIVQSRIPFPEKRKLETRRYAIRHYGLRTYRLRDPKVIVEHYTGSDSYRSAYDTFARDLPDVELHELPGVCAHFIVDRSGVIHQLVSLRLICRHTVGLNWTAIGIEHVGTSDGEILANKRQLRASLQLTRWLQSKFGIETRNVIGHSESLRSPYHRERVRALRRQTHSDFSHAAMKRYRRRLAGVSSTGVPVRRRPELTGLPLRRIGPLPGTATRWQNHRLPGTTAFVAELPPGPLERASLRRYTSAVLALARAQAREPQRER